MPGAAWELLFPSRWGDSEERADEEEEDGSNRDLRWLFSLVRTSQPSECGR
jgi:hypothetical protein